MLTRIIGACLAVVLGAALAVAQTNWPTAGGSVADGRVVMCVDGGGNAVQCKSFNFKNITTQTETLVKSGAGVLHTICINTPANNGTATVYDNVTSTGTLIGKITSFTAVQGCFTYDAAFATGLDVVTSAGNIDLTVTYR